MKRLSYTIITAATLLSGGCAPDEYYGLENSENESGKIILAAHINQEAVTRANDDGFANGDIMGVYIVDYEGNNPGTLLSKGNRGDNVKHTFDEEAYRWNSAYDIYWKDDHTRIDVYGYYPIGSPEDVNAYDFTVLADQSIMPADGNMGNYEASDFLWGKVAGVEPSSRIIRLPMTHRMANARVTLVEGVGFESGEWATLRKQVLVTNTIRKATIDLSTGVATPQGAADRSHIIPAERNDEWRAIVVPQTIAAGMQLFSITIDGTPYKFSKNEDFAYIAGKMNNFGIRVDKKTPEGKYTLTLISESITPWENDLVSHDATSKEYVIVESTPGGLENAITAAGKDFRNIRNLKITGEIDAADFHFMNDKMEKLQALKRKEV
ncbi:MAG: fimbrillin family protein, partial [Muribaculaceae bacterium]|nr:fimbrillin family protein [Muribaculaceae bacterium]